MVHLAETEGMETEAAPASSPVAPADRDWILSLDQNWLLGEVLPFLSAELLLLRCCNVCSVWRAW
ncbi:unnamed protein product [Sphacelaria rigidula]